MIRVRIDHGVGSSLSVAWMYIHWGKGRGYIGGRTLRLYWGPTYNRWSVRAWIRTARNVKRSYYDRSLVVLG